MHKMSSPNSRQSPRPGVNERNDQAEKRKATMAMSDDDNSDRSALMPTKKARIEHSPSKSPVTPSDETLSPTKLLYPPPKDKIEPNIDLSMGPLLEDDDESQNGATALGFKSTLNSDDKDEASHFVLPSPLNTNDESGKSKDEHDNGAESDSDSDKFFADIKAREEMQLEQKHYEEEDSSPRSILTTTRRQNILTTSSGYGAPVSVPHMKKVEPPFYTIAPDGKVISSSSTEIKCYSASPSSMDSDYMSSPVHPVEVELRVYCGNTKTLLFDTSDVMIKSNYETMSAFLRHHGREIGCASSSGYSGDMSSMASTCDSQSQSLEFCRPKFLSIGSTISTIPRPSDASTISRPSVIGGEVRNRSAVELPKQGKSSKLAPALSSTRIEEKKSSSLNENLDINSNANGNKAVFSNGNGDQQPEESERTPESAAALARNTPRSNRRGRPPNSAKEKSFLSASSSTEMSSSDSTSLNSQLQGMVKHNSETNSEDQSTDSSARSRNSGKKRNPKHESDDEESESRTLEPLSDAVNKAIEEFSAERFSKSATLWGVIAGGELVFARWRDRSYYSGVITEKGANDTWQIHYDDDMDDVASETHILPIKVIGVGTHGIYCPEGIYKPEDVVVIGSRSTNSDGTEIATRDVEYAVVTKNTGKLIFCTRKNLTIRERDAKLLRRRIYTSVVIGKAAEVSFDNIVSGPRRRLVAESLTPSDKIRRLIQLEQTGSTGFDISGSDAQLLQETTTPTQKRAGKNAIISSSGGGNTARKLSIASDSTGEESSDVTHHTPSASEKITSFKSNAATSSSETPKSGSKDMAKKTRKEKRLFEGMQFFMTASGGDPSGTDVPYDKDDFRDLIEKAGGSIVDTVGAEAKRNSKPTYLISDSYARTVKYIYCLAAGIPCVSHIWIQSCLDQNKIVDWESYQLDSGFSLEEQRVIPAHEHRPLKDLKIYVTAESCDLYNYWKPVLTAAEANLLKLRKKGPLIPAETEVLVTDATCPSNVVSQALRKHTPIVKPEWLVQTIILGKRASYNGHEKYQLETDASPQDDIEIPSQEVLSRLYKTHCQSYLVSTYSTLAGNNFFANVLH